MIDSPRGMCVSYFSSAVPGDVMEIFFGFSRNPIHELEIHTVFTACLLWGALFKGALVVYYIYSESARMAFVKGNGETTFACRLVYDFVCLESEMQHRTWFGRFKISQSQQSLRHCKKAGHSWV